MNVRYGFFFFRSMVLALISLLYASLCTSNHYNIHVGLVSIFHHIQYMQCIRKMFPLLSACKLIDIFLIPTFCTSDVQRRLSSYTFYRLYSGVNHAF